MNLTISPIEKPKRKCLSCGKVYQKNHKYSKSQWINSKYCSKKCLLNRERTLKVTEKRICNHCNNKFDIDKKLSNKQKDKLRYCSTKCAGEAKKVNDGLSKDERHRRKLGQLKMGTPEWLERIRSTTKDAMLKPEINIKLRKPRRPQSLESRIKHSNALAGRLPKNMMFGANGAYPNIQRGDYECSKGSMYFRSKWEANYALYLDFLVKQKQIKDWEFETDVFVFDKIQFGTRSYRPDFKVFTNDGLFEYHEVKGYMDSKSKTKLKRMAKYYPDVKLILIDTPVYNDIKKKIGKMLCFY